MALTGTEADHHHEVVVVKYTRVPGGRRNPHRKCGVFGTGDIGLP